MYRPVPLLPFVLITACAVLLALLTAGSAGRGLPRVAPGAPARLVRHAPGFRWTVLAAAVVVPVALTLGQRYYPPTRLDVPYLLGLYLAVAAVTTPLVWEAGRFYLLATPAGLDGRSPWRGARAIAWDDLESVAYRPLPGWFEFRGRDGQTLRAFGFAAGLDDLFRLVEAHVPAAALVRARAGYARLGRPFPALPDEPILEARPPRL